MNYFVDRKENKKFTNRFPFHLLLRIANALFSYFQSQQMFPFFCNSILNKRLGCKNEQKQPTKLKSSSRNREKEIYPNRKPRDISLKCRFQQIIILISNSNLSLYWSYNGHFEAGRYLVLRWISAWRPHPIPTTIHLNLAE